MVIYKMKKNVKNELKKQIRSGVSPLFAAKRYAIFDGVIRPRS